MSRQWISVIRKRPGGREAVARALLEAEVWALLPDPKAEWRRFVARQGVGHARIGRPRKGGKFNRTGM